MDRNDYKLVKSDLLVKGNIMDMYRDTLIMPNGKEATREYIVRGAGASAIVPIDDDGRIIFVKQYRHPIKDFTIEIPAGMLEVGEDPYICAERELEEETGKKSNNIKHLCNMHSAVGICTEGIYIYVAEDLKPGVQNFDPDEFIELETYTVDEAIEMIFSGKITDSKTMVGILAYKESLCRNKL